MAIYLLAYLASFSGQLHFRRCYFLTLLQSNKLDTIVTLLGQLFLQSSCSFEELLFQNSYFFRVTLLPSSHFVRTENSLGQLLLGTATFSAEELFKIKISTGKLFFRTRYFCQVATFQKSYILEKTYQKMLRSIAGTFFRRANFWKHTFFRRSTISWLRFFFIVTPPTYQLLIKWASYPF